MSDAFRRIVLVDGAVTAGHLAVFKDTVGAFVAEPLLVEDGGAPGGTGTVTHTAGALTANELVVGNGSADIKTVGATDGQIPIGKTSDGSVTLATITPGTNITVTNGPGSVTISASGGGGSGTVTNTGTLTSGKAIVGNGGVDVTVSAATGVAHLASGTLTGSNVDLASEVTGVLTTAHLSTPVKTRAITFVIDGGGSALTTGVKADVYVPYACTITGVTLLADQSGSVVVDIWKDTYANYPPTVGDSITASALPTISSALKAQDSTLTGWTTSISAGDTLRFNVNSATSITRLNLTLTVTL